MWAHRSSKHLNDAFEALANERRRAIVYRLSLRPASISELADGEKLSLPAIHKHIKILERAKLVQRKKVGRTNFLALDRTALRVLRDWLSQYHAYWGANEETLENYAAGLERREQALKNKKKSKK
jgi:DNA-binding transcriptional ArsR family regulator